MASVQPLGSLIPVLSSSRPLPSLSQATSTVSSTLQVASLGQLFSPPTFVLDTRSAVHLTRPPVHCFACARRPPLLYEYGARQDSSSHPRSTSQRLSLCQQPPSPDRRSPLPCLPRILPLGLLFPRARTVHKHHQRQQQPPRFASSVRLPRPFLIFFFLLLLQRLPDPAFVLSSEHLM